MSAELILTGLFIFLARILDVSLGTIRTILTIQGKLVASFCLGAIEATVWILVVNEVIRKVGDSPVLIIFYALGFASGNVVGILVERELAIGPIVLKIFTKERQVELIEAFKELDIDLTSYTGQGIMGPVTELYVICRRRDLKTIINTLNSIDPEAFYVTEQVRTIKNELRPLKTQVTGWRAVLKKK